MKRIKIQLNEPSCLHTGSFHGRLVFQGLDTLNFEISNRLLTTINIFNFINALIL